MRKKRGFTLLEMLTSLAIFALVMSSMTLIFCSIVKDWQNQKYFTESFTASRLALDFMSGDLQLCESDAVRAHDSGSGIPDGQVLYFEIDKVGSGFGWGSWSSMTHVWYWKGDGGSKGNLDTLYRGQSTSWWTSFSYANAARQEMMNHLVSANFTVTGEGTQQSAVTVDLTLRPRTTVAEGPGNRNYRLRTMVRPRN